MDQSEKKRLYNRMDNLADNVNQILIELDNGLKSEVKNNSTAIKELKKEIESLQKEVAGEQQRKAGKAILINNIGWIIGIISTLLLIKDRLGVLF